MQNRFARLLLAGLIAAGFSPFQRISANSYSYGYLPESALPKEIVEVAAFHTHGVTVVNGRRETIQSGDLVPSPEAIRGFFNHGIWSIRKPVFGFEKQLADLEKSAERAAIEYSKNIFGNESVQEARKKEVEEFEKRFVSIREKIRRIRGSEGAVLSSDGEIFLWRLVAPTVMEVYKNAEGLCHLRIADHNVAELRERTENEAGTALPETSEGDFPLSRDFLPGTGSDYPIGREIVRQFLDRGEITDLPRLQEIGDRHVTEYRIPVTKHMLERKALANREWELDMAGNRIVGHALYDSQFNCVFAADDQSLWRAKLLNDSHLELDGDGRLFVVEIKEISAKGYGVPAKQ